MEIKSDLCSNATRKIALLITKASDLGMDISGYGFADEKQSSGNVYLWLEDYQFTLFIGLGDDTIYASLSDPMNGDEEEIEVCNKTLAQLELWAEQLYTEAAIAVEYATSKGEYTAFNNMYSGFRQYNGIADSIRMSLIYLYGINITKKILGADKIS